MPDIAHTTKTSFIGVRMRQYWIDLALWEYLLQCTPVKAILELGTHKGGLSLYLALQSIQRQFKFWTVDIKEYIELGCKVADRIELKSHFTKGDIFGNLRQPIIDFITLPENQPVILFCDGGNKPREVATFTPYLLAGSIVGTHDWGTQFKPKDIRPVAHLVEPYIFPLFEENDSFTRFWKRSLEVGNG